MLLKQLAELVLLVAVTIGLWPGSVSPANHEIQITARIE